MTLLLHIPSSVHIQKILLNSLWGKFAQKADHSEVVYTRTPAAFHLLLEDPTLDIADFVHINENLDRVLVRKKPAFAKAPPTNNIPVAAFVTSLARLRLYMYLEAVEECGGTRLYCDTDSILYARKLNGGSVSEGDFLGEMKREHPGRRIFDFVAAGPKNYGYRHRSGEATEDDATHDTKSELKIRGITLHYNAQQQLNYDRVRQLIRDTFQFDGNL